MIDPLLPIAARFTAFGAILVTLSCKTVTFRNIQAVIFDKDGTLENSGAFYRTLAQKATRLIDAQVPGVGEPLLMAFGAQAAVLDPLGLMAVGSRQDCIIGAAAYIAETGKPWTEALQIAQTAFEQADEYMAQDGGVSPLFPTVLPVLAHLQQAGLKLAILSADTDDLVQKFVQNHQLQGYFTAALGLEPDGLNKPNPMLYQKICDRVGVNPENTVIVGDSGYDWQMGHAVGAGVIGIRWGNVAAVPAREVDVAIADLAEIAVEQE